MNTKILNFLKNDAKTRRRPQIDIEAFNKQFPYSPQLLDDLRSLEYYGVIKVTPGDDTICMITLLDDFKND